MSTKAGRTRQSVEDVPADIDSNSSPVVEEGCDTKRRLTSSVWKEFKRRKIDNKWKAECMWCHKKLGGETKNGTKHLHDHLKYCLYRRDNKGGKQAYLRTLKDANDVKLSIETYTFNQEVARMELARMIILHEYPLSIVEHYGFRRFVSALQPLFKMVSKSTIKKDIISVYETERMRAMKLLDEIQGRVAITTNMWTSDDQNRGYMSVKAHFIDHSWTLQSCLVRFMYIPWPHTAEVIGDTLFNCLRDWNLDKKLSMLTVDNCSTRDSVMNLLEQRLETGHLLLGGSLRCCAYTLNLIANEGLEVMGGALERIRGSVAFWTATPKREEMFEEAAHDLNVSFDKKLTLDCNTRWNSTFAMLTASFNYKEVFDHLQQREKQFICAPYDEDWKLAKEICARLKSFYDIAEMFSGSKYVTANVYFPKICGIRIAMRKWPVCENDLIERMHLRMVEKFDKYWTEVYHLMAVATVLDPRYKLELLKFYFPALFGDESSNKINEVRQLCYDLVSYYQGKLGTRSESMVTFMQSTVDEGEDSDQLSSFDLYIASKSSTVDVKSELDHYLEEPVIPRTVDFDILGWWKMMGMRYPTLQMIARDILAIPVSSVVSESAFSITERVVSPQRSRLTPNTLEVLMCSQDWLRTENRDAVCSTLFGSFTCLEDADVMEESSLVTS